MTDMVNHPPHYTSHGSGVEAVDITRYCSFNIGNAIKYILRHAHKGTARQDLEKAAWYLNDHIENLSDADAMSYPGYLNLLQMLHYEKYNREMPKELYDALTLISVQRYTEALSTVKSYIGKTY